jgi:hypothetical protein
LRTDTRPFRRNALPQLSRTFARKREPCGANDHQEGGMNPPFRTGAPAQKIPERAPDALGTSFPDHP